MKKLHIYRRENGWGGIWVVAHSINDAWKIAPVESHQKGGQRGTYKFVRLPDEKRLGLPEFTELVTRKCRIWAKLNGRGILFEENGYG